MKYFGKFRMSNFLPGSKAELRFYSLIDRQSKRQCERVRPVAEVAFTKGSDFLYANLKFKCEVRLPSLVLSEKQEVGSKADLEGVHPQWLHTHYYLPSYLGTRKIRAVRKLTKFALYWDVAVV